MLIHYVIVTVLTIVGTAYASLLIRRTQRGARIDRERLELQDKILEGKTFPALEAAGQAVEASQNLIFAIQQAMIGKTK